MSAAPASVFGTRLKEARLEAGLSQKQLGIEAGLDPFVASTRINRYELGVHKVDYTFAIRLATVLEVPVAFLYAEDSELASLILAFGRLSKRKRADLLLHARSLEAGS
ncbi:MULTISPECIES: helix-turn-helix domain-containing protein [Paraburkholderia]|uniref:helix-turn-helix domain-containing protein n=1 Tax=Paraburkholderia TaxID=1822464 RepID=UPI002860890B|nr:MULTISPECIES: helix-turn-helix transcriptional regulator [Paraburkholderia]MDR6383434.1 transcriptional regulator with XRE-family HTH domain [Paraburkholderia caribensis]MDR6388894.1 transcriptional regulator with XRE-family HTH domain [Paraburkholderia phenoliruptrix]MDR6419205.1 transcriptional regulator with XRE-family HTH domain [Paraburkholderia phenoliruptrix]